MRPAGEIDTEDEFPADLVREMGELGLMGMTVPEEGDAITIRMRSA